MTRIAQDTVTLVAVDNPVNYISQLWLRLLRWIVCWAILVKAPLTLMASLPAVAAYLLLAESTGLSQTIWFTVGVVCAGCGAATINQCWESGFDARMARTRNRPLPTGALSLRTAILAAALFTVFGGGILWAKFSPLSGVLAILTVAWYILLYTPLKRHTPWCTEVGAVCGALPPLIGAAAAGVPGAPLAWMLAAILWVWQIPHFHPIAWRYRNDYQSGGFKMLAASEETIVQAGRRALAYALILIPLSLTPVFAGAGILYVVPVTLSGLMFAMIARLFQRPQGRDQSARLMFRYSLFHITLLLTLLLVDFRAGA